MQRLSPKRVHQVKPRFRVLDMPLKSPVTCILFIQPATIVLVQPAPSDFTPFWLLCSGLLGKTGFDQIISWLSGLGAGGGNELWPYLMSF